MIKLTWDGFTGDNILLIFHFPKHSSLRNLVVCRGKDNGIQQQLLSLNRRMIITMSSTCENPREVYEAKSDTDLLRREPELNWGKRGEHTAVSQREPAKPAQ